MSNKNSSYLILGGARSGKSHYAETLAKESSKEVVYIATAHILDDEIAQRVSRHKDDRPSDWITIEEPLTLAASLIECTSQGHIVIVDCLTMWITNLLSQQDESMLEKELAALLSVIEELPGSIIFVSNEVGMGIIPMGELTRKYVDEAGRLHQQLAQRVDHVVLMVAGLPHIIKSPAIIT